MVKLSAGGMGVEGGGGKILTLQAARCVDFCDGFCSEQSLNWFQSEV